MNPIESFLEYLRAERRYSALTVRAYGDDIREFVRFCTVHDEGAEGSFDPRCVQAGDLRAGTIPAEQVAPYPPRGQLQASLAEVPTQAINSLPGVVKLVSFGGIPKSLPAREIEALRQHLNDLNAQGGLPTHSFRPGDQIRLRDGPLEGLEAVFLGPMTPSQRVRVLLDFLGTQREAEVAIDSIERVAPTPQRGRRTRGPARTGPGRRAGGRWPGRGRGGGS